MANIKMTAQMLRDLADKIDNAEQYHNMVGTVYVTIGENGIGKRVLTFEQRCSYADCNSVYYRYTEV